MEYSVLEKVFLALVGGLISPILSVIILIWSRRRLKEDADSESRSFLFYSALSGILLGQYVCHTAVVPDRFYTRIMNMCALAGFFLLYFFESEYRMWNAVPEYIQPPDGQLAVDGDSGLQRSKMEQDSLVSARGVNTSEMPRTIFGTQDVAKDETKRIWLLVLLYINLAFVLCIDGLLLVYRSESSNHAAVVACFVLNGTALSVAIYSAMIHAKYHSYEEFKRNGLWRWILLTFVWSAMLLCSTIPVLMNLNSATWIIENYVLLCLYGVASGFLLKLCFYYFNRGVEASRRRMIRLGVLVFALAAGQSAATGVWL